MPERGESLCNASIAVTHGLFAQRLQPARDHPPRSSPEQNEESDSHPNHAEGVYIIKALALYIINSAGIAYHQNAVLYIIIAKADTAYG